MKKKSTKSALKKNVKLTPKELVNKEINKRLHEILDVEEEHVEKVVIRYLQSINIEDQFRQSMKVSLEAIIRKFIRAELECIERNKTKLIEINDYCYLKDIPRNKVREYIKKNKINTFKVGDAIFIQE